MLASTSSATHPPTLTVLRVGHLSTLACAANDYEPQSPVRALLQRRRAAKVIDGHRVRIPRATLGERCF